MVHIKVTSSSAMAERPRATHAPCTVTFRANSYGPLDGRMVILQICRWKFSHVLLKLNFIQKTKNRFLSNPLGTSRLRTLSIYSSLESPWSTYYIHCNWTFFAISYGGGKSEAEICRSRRFSKGVGHFERKFQTEGGVARQPLLVSEN